MIHIFGAPGAGVTTLGRALAEKIGYTHLDVDDYVWFTDDALPYRRKRNTEHRLRLLIEDLDKNPDVVLSGSLCGWGDVLIPRFKKVVYLWLPAEIRLARITQRERARYGPERLAPGGDLHTVFEKFKAWAADYDTPGEQLRGRARELAWLAALPCPVLDLSGVDEGVESLVERVAAII